MCRAYSSWKSAWRLRIEHCGFNDSVHCLNFHPWQADVQDCCSIRVFGPNRDKLQLGMALCICDFGTGVNRPEDAFLFDINGKKHNLCRFSAAD